MQGGQVLLEGAPEDALEVAQEALRAAGERISWPATPPTPAPPAAKAAPSIVPPIAAPSAPAHVKSVEEVDDSDKCIICMDRVVNVKFKGCNHSMTCRECT
eukprot:CAMPEP_0182498212 /NCGR_PEP_ID=MMETSP1321-20130603/6484_1 /TAXON_ID=91990 /ORGANISM="Bolidomonas sp., Strain RCC1657" /LENGTH=100 /DNA_ID=CAMNT_0024702243 /DNA_START=195 /DNA_END=494 /DNA_ORIENTATION=+